MRVVLRADLRSQIVLFGTRYRIGLSCRYLVEGGFQSQLLSLHDSGLGQRRSWSLSPLTRRRLHHIGIRITNTLALTGILPDLLCSNIDLVPRAYFYFF
jgi:hypothetical protein